MRNPFTLLVKKGVMLAVVKKRIVKRLYQEIDANRNEVLSCIQKIVEATYHLKGHTLKEDIP